MVAAVIKVVENRIVVSVEGTSLLAPVVASAVAAQAAAEGSAAQSAADRVAAQTAAASIGQVMEPTDALVATWPWTKSFPRSFTKLVPVMQVGVDVAAGTPITAIVVNQTFGSTATTLRLTVKSRATGAGNAAAAPDAGSDVVLATGTASLAGVTADVATDVKISLGAGFVAPANSFLYFILTATDASNVLTTMGIAGFDDIGATGTRNGWYIVPANPTAWVPTPNDNHFSVRLLTGGFRAAGRVWSPADAIESCVALARTPAQAAIGTSSGFGIPVTIQGVLRREGVGIDFGGSVVLDQPANGAVTDEASSLVVYTNNGPRSNTEYRLGSAKHTGALTRAALSSVVVKRTSDNVVQTLGTDYDLNVSQGVVAKHYTLNPADPAVPVKVSYAYSRQRYDTIYLDPETKLISRVQGTERDRDAAEYRGVSTNPSLMELFVARVTKDAVELLPRWSLEDGLPRPLRGEIDALRIHNLRILAPFRKKLRSGTAIIAVTGDSTAAIEFTSGNPLVANGTGRDRPEYLNVMTGTDRTAAPGSPDPTNLMTRYDHGDGAGNVHVHLTAPWALKTYWEAEHAVTITLNNFAVGGGDSDPSSANDLLSPGHLNAVLDSAPDLIMVDIGVNDVPQTPWTTQANIVTFMAAVKVKAAALAKPISVVFILPSPANPNAGENRVDDRWANVCRQIVRAAMSNGAAIVDSRMVWNDRFPGVTGVAKADWMQADGTVHPGISEFAALNRAAIALLT